MPEFRITLRSEESGDWLLARTHAELLARSMSLRFTETRGPFTVEVVEVVGDAERVLDAWTVADGQLL